MTLQLSYVAHSDIGLIRKNNQDSGYASPHLLVVADGAVPLVAALLAEVRLQRGAAAGVQGHELIETEPRPAPADPSDG